MRKQLQNYQELPRSYHENMWTKSNTRHSKNTNGATTTSASNTHIKQQYPKQVHQSAYERNFRPKHTSTPITHSPYPSGSGTTRITTKEGKQSTRLSNLATTKDKTETMSNQQHGSTNMFQRNLSNRQQLSHPQLKKGKYMSTWSDPGDHDEPENYGYEPDTEYENKGKGKIHISLGRTAK